ncbi:MAG TPA: M20/M25/M40 family metallo-hydrolase [Longimicrobium sp.]|nr:M20/M25/M40 family metallo-hydrolase [Longimicrobium sp.]
MRPDHPRRSASPAALAALALLAACAPSAGPRPESGTGAAGPAAAQAPVATRLEDVRDHLHALAHDSMLGRYTGEEGMWRSARYIARQLQGYGVEPAGDDGFFQRMPLGIVEGRNGRLRPALLGSWADTATVPAERRRVGVNVVGILRGADPARRDQAVVIGAHFDHLGIGRAVDGDSVYNGADDDASGVVAVLEVARALSRGPRPARTVVFLLTSGEEVGMTGTNWYIGHPVVPLERTVADLQIEMIGRPDTAAGGPGKAWLTGYERSTMGEMLAAQSIPIIPDPRPRQDFFLRSDNIAFAYKGIPGHTLSSYGLHGDYHQPSDEVERIDFAHMTEVVRAAVRAARLLADGPAPVWKPGGRPTPPGS